MAQAGPTATYASLTTQLAMGHVWKDMVYAHYSLHTSTPTLAVRAELGAYPTYIPGISRLSNYMSYLCSTEAPPLVSKAPLVQKALAHTSKFSWWNNTYKSLLTPSLILPQTPRTTSAEPTVDGGSPKSTPPTHLNYPPSANSTHHSTQHHTSIQDHTTSARKPSASAAPTTV